MMRYELSSDLSGAVKRAATCLLFFGSSLVACHRSPASGEASGVAPPDSAPAATSADSVASSAVRFVESFYAWYQASGERFETAVRDSPAVFDRPLLEAMQVDLEAQARHPEEVVGLDWDPFLAAQDPCNPYRAQQAARRQDTILVSIRGMCPDREAAAAPDVVAELRWLRGRWVFTDFRHGSDSGSLMQDLAELRRARASAGQGK
jgi:hypothetical protein